MPKFSKISIMVINYNGLKWLKRCLSSISKTDYQNFNIYLVDNCSTDGSLNYVKSNFPKVGIIKFQKNLGFAEAYNRAIEEIKTDYILLLNNDTEILDPKWIQNLIKITLKDSKIVATTCKMVSMIEPSRLDSVGGMGIPFWRGFVDIGRGEVDHGQYDKKDFEPFSFCGGAALIKRDVFIKSKGFDSKFFMYFEDVDLSWRLRLLGYRITLAPDAKVSHYSSGSTQGRDIDAKRFYLCHRNFLRMILKNSGQSLKWAISNYIIYSVIASLGAGISEPMKAVVVVKSIIWNLIHLKDTYSWRLRIQANRREDEIKILKKMYPRIKRYEPMEHTSKIYINLRRILNTLFEYSQRHYIYE